MSMQHRRTTSHHSNSAQKPISSDQEYRNRRFQPNHWRILFAIVLIVLIATPGVSQSRSPILLPEQPTAANQTNHMSIMLPFVQRSAATPAIAEVIPQPFGTHGNWNLIFHDEFAGAALDQRKWVNCYLWDTLGCYKTNGSELEWYLPENVSVGDGIIQLQGQQRSVTGGDGNNYNYTSGIISSGMENYDPAITPRFAFQYGYVEMRAMVPAGQGFWSAFWLLRADRVLPWEIDIFEVLGDQPQIANLTVHYPQPDGSTGQNGDAVVGANLASGYHTYAIEWTADTIVWLIDGVERKRENNPAHIPHDPMYLIANLAIGGTWPGPPDATTVFPNALQIDYIRVWQPAQ
jgi:beta-glucanase (GH16 family)